MSSQTDYYQTLGVSKNASQEDIKQAYRKLAREHHPDMVEAANKESAEKKFKEINEAYQILGDPQKRKMYDQFGTADPNAGFGRGAGQGAGGQWGPFSYTYSSGGPGGAAGGNPFDFAGGDFDPFDIFEDFFGFRGFGGTRRPKKGKNLHYEMTIDFKDAVFGMEKSINIESGNVSIKIPAGVRNGTELRFSGKGMLGAAGMPSGDLFITLHVKEPTQFEIIDDNILSKVEINFIDAILGSVIEVPIVDLSNTSGIGYTKLKIPSGTQYGTKFVVRGKGIPKLNGKGQGDAYVQVLIGMPKKLSKNQKDLLDQYARLK